MPRLQAKVEGKGNGVKTVIPNMVDIARALGRPPTYTTKYFGCELGAQTQMDHKNDRYIVNGLHDATKLQDMLDGFIRKFVLCEKCDNPETVLKVKKGMIGASCKACGHIFTMDMTHKLTTFIIKNPPNQDLSAHGTSLTDKKTKRSKRKEQQQDIGNGGSANNNLDTTANEDDVDDDWDDDEDWGEDTSEEAQRQRMKELTSGVKTLAMDSDLEKSEHERINIFHDFIKKKIATDGLANADKEIHAESERLEVTNKAVIVLCELLLSDNILTQVKKHVKLFLRFTHENQKAQKYLMGGIEKTIEARKDTLVPKTAHILKAFYDLDILEEEVILDWAKKVSKKYVGKELAETIHKKAEPFIKWLKEADEESEDEESDVELEFDERAKISTIKQVQDKPVNNNTTNGKKEEQENDDDEDDIDIDDI